MRISALTIALVLVAGCSNAHDAAGDAGPIACASGFGFAPPSSPCDVAHVGTYVCTGGHGEECRACAPTDGCGTATHCWSGFYDGPCSPVLPPRDSGATSADASAD